ncbi:MAG: hypothetical protein MZW92_05005 [Comamonadaceae bacterium]|nr:hypothetical protein [Comamonadaceae bacterium]
MPACSTFDRVAASLVVALIPRGRPARAASCNGRPDAAQVLAARRLTAGSS